MRYRLRFDAILCAVMLALLGLAAPLRGQPASGTVKGFVRVNGKTLTVSHAYAVTAPDGFDPSVPVQLILLTPKPIEAGALASANDRNAVFRLVPVGAIVEIGKNGHTVFLYHAALGDNRLQTGGGFPEFKTASNRISGDVHTFMSGDQDEFGYKVRFELAFDAPIVKRLSIAKPTTTTTTNTPAPGKPAPAKPPAGPLPKTRDEATKWLIAQGLGVGDEALGVYFVLTNKGLSTDVVRAYLLSGVSPNHVSMLSGDTPLNALTVACPGQAQAAEIARVLIDAGANVNHQEKEGRKATPVMGAVFCPDLLPMILAKKPNLYAVDANGMTVMHYALRFGGKSRDKIARMLVDAGFDVAKYRKSLLEEVDAAFLDSLSKPAAPAAKSPGPAAAATTAPAATPVARAAAIDWKATGPYPARSKTEAIRALARPGADTTIDDHFWDGIAHNEPQRLAIALQAGANVRSLRQPMGYAPLVYLAESCDVDDDVEEQVAIAEQLIAAGADLTGVDPNRANALAIGAHKCPIAVIRAFIKAGMALQVVDVNKNTALKAAILAERVDVVDALLDAGLDLKKEPYNVGRFASINKQVEAAVKKKRR